MTDLKYHTQLQRNHEHEAATHGVGGRHVRACSAEWKGIAKFLKVKFTRGVEPLVSEEKSNCTLKKISEGSGERKGKRCRQEE